jgi:HSP20 family molecular chaperone IbpA
MHTGMRQEVSMSEITITRVSSLEDRTLPVFAEVEKLKQDIGRRASELFAARGCGEGHALDDWLQAEREVCWPATELVENARQFVCNVALPGYAAADIEVTVNPREIVVHADRRSHRGEEGDDKEARLCWSEFRAIDVYRRIELPAATEVDAVRAELHEGLLRITAPKVIATPSAVGIAEAA